MTKKSREEILQRAKAVLAQKVDKPYQPEPGSDEEVQMFIDEALAQAKASCRRFWPDQTS